MSYDSNLPDSELGTAPRHYTAFCLKLSLPVLVKSLFIWAMNPENHIDLLCTQADSGKDDDVILLGIQGSMPEFQPAFSVGVKYAGLRNPFSQSHTVGDREEDSLESLLMPTVGKRCVGGHLLLTWVSPLKTCLFKFGPITGAVAT